MNNQSPSLTFTPISAESLLALVDSREAFHAEFGVPATEGLRELMVSDDVSPEYWQMLRESVGVDPWRFGFAIVDVLRGEVVGTAGFKGPPD